MKKFIFVIFGILCLSFFTACGDIYKPNEIELQLDGNCKVQFDGQNYECSVTRTSENIGVVKITNPEELRGLTFSWQNGECELAMKDLSGSFNKEVLPQESFALCIMEVLKSASTKENIKFVQKKDEENIFDGTSIVGKYEIYTDFNGKIKKIKIEEKRLEIIFV